MAGGTVRHPDPLTQERVPDCGAGISVESIESHLAFLCWYSYYTLFSTTLHAAAHLYVVA